MDILGVSFGREFAYFYAHFDFLGFNFDFKRRIFNDGANIICRPGSRIHLTIGSFFSTISRAKKSFPKYIKNHLSLSIFHSRGSHIF